ncbi:DUF1203 domain-containing protein [Cohaesibacter intestini]|uniref:DUF1203 domain-containing protein n=1 Tax=Cohaesibacter intestini TaxID=2211145 RepID=UPI000DE9F398|nr:DUF1203 domain-containing protein [Cohaesibacter intestini]
MSFQISGLEPDQFSHLFGLSDDVLKQQGVIRYQVEECPGFPDRVGLRDMAIGETALLLNYEHLPVQSPYRSRHAIFICEGPQQAAHYIDQVPDVMTRRVISLRAFDEAHHIIHADLASGDEIRTSIEAFLADPAVRYIHAHYAKPGCFAAEICRVP